MKTINTEKFGKVYYHESDYEANLRLQNEKTPIFSQAIYLIGSLMLFGFMAYKGGGWLVFYWIYLAFAFWGSCIFFQEVEKKKYKENKHAFDNPNKIGYFVYFFINLCIFAYFGRYLTFAFLLIIYGFVYHANLKLYDFYKTVTNEIFLLKNLTNETKQ